MPFVAKIRCDDPFRSADQREIGAMCRRIAAASEHCSFTDWREESRLPSLSLHDLGEGARDAALDRPQRHRAAADAQARPDAGGSGRGESVGANDHTSLIATWLRFVAKTADGDDLIGQ
jgi:hypothetical protein